MLYRSSPAGGSSETGSPGRSSSSQRRSWQDLIETPLTEAGLHYLQTGPLEDAVFAEPGLGGGSMMMLSGGVYTLPAQRNVPLPMAMHRLVPMATQGGKPRSFTLPRDSNLHSLLALPPRGDPHAHNGGSEGASLGELFRACEQSGVCPLGRGSEGRADRGQAQFRQSFLRRADDPELNERLHHLRILTSTLKDKEGELTLIDRLLSHPQLSSSEFKEWKRAYKELFTQDAVDEGEDSDPGPPPLTPSLSHTHSYIETHVDWVDRLPWVILGLRSAPKEDLQASSAELVYGQPLRVPGEAFAPIPTSRHGLPQSYVAKALPTAEYVFIRHDGHRAVLQAPYDGPFCVLEQTASTGPAPAAGVPSCRCS
uniref:Uncharacterized protein n=1 Tax=Knipowitschia caucasica TaxID=637954 RepID=A0AAV2L5R8_KNICA